MDVQGLPPYKHVMLWLNTFCSSLEMILLRLIAVLHTNVDTEFEVSLLGSSVCHLNAA